jgi:hypothetical protein
MGMAATRTARTLAPAAAKRAVARPTTTERRIVEGRVTEVLPDGRAKLVTSAGLTIACRCPQHVNVDWLRAAVAVAPVEAEASTTGRAGTLWCLLPGPEHRDVAASHLELVAKDTLKIACGEATLSLDKAGTIRVRGRDVTTRGSRVARLQGGTVRIN